MSLFDMAHAFTAKWEGGFSDVKEDSGGFTAYGVSTAFMTDFAKIAKNRPILERFGLAGPVNRTLMKKITPEAAKAIFKAAFWDRLSLDEASAPMAIAVYDSSVNCGIARGVKWGQQAINNKRGKLLVVDGLIGPKTIAAWKSAAYEEACEAVWLRIAFYKNLAAAKPSQKVFLRGWLNRANDLLAYLGNHRAYCA